MCKNIIVDVQHIIQWLSGIKPDDIYKEQHHWHLTSENLQSTFEMIVMSPGAIGIVLLCQPN